YDPPIKLMEALLSEATTIADAGPPTEFLERRNSDEAARVLIRIVETRKQAKDVRAPIIFSALSRMTTPLAEKALMRNLTSASRDARAPPALASCGIPRGEEAGQLATDSPNMPADERQKRLVVSKIFQVNPQVLDGIKLQIDKVQDPAVQDIVFSNGQV